MSDSAAAAPTAAPAKICTLTKVEMVGSWTISIATEDCGICKSGIKETCIECVASEADPSECNVSEGECGHNFHTHCINRWVRGGTSAGNNNNCPQCQNPWQTAKVHSIAA